MIDLIRQTQQQDGMSLVLVMYAGRIVETRSAAPVFDYPANPYTQALISAVSEGLEQDHRNTPRILWHREPPGPVRSLQGGRFNPRCWRTTDLCRIQELSETVEPASGYGAGRAVRVWRWPVPPFTSAAPVWTSQTAQLLTS